MNPLNNPIDELLGGLTWYLIILVIIIIAFIYLDYKLRKINKDSDARIMEIMNKYKVPSFVATLIIFLGIDDLLNNNGNS